MAPLSQRLGTAETQTNTLSTHRKCKGQLPLIKQILSKANTRLVSKFPPSALQDGFLTPVDA